MGINKLLDAVNNMTSTAGVSNRVENAGERPCLKLAEDRFLHFFRNYYFQIAFNPEADGEVAAGTFNLQNLIHSTKFKFVANTDLAKVIFFLLIYILVFLRIIDTGFIQSLRIQRM